MMSRGSSLRVELDAWTSELYVIEARKGITFGRSVVQVIIPTLRTASTSMHGGLP